MLPEPLPQTWSLDSYFPAFDGEAHRDFVANLRNDLARHLAAAKALELLGAINVTDWAGVFIAVETLGARLHHLASYYSCLGAADAANENYQTAKTALARIGAEFTKLLTTFLAGLREVDEPTWHALLENERLVGATYNLIRLRAKARFQMAASEESLAADLAVDGVGAWGQLYSTISGKMMFPMRWPDGREENLPIAQRRALLSHTDRAVRAAAFAGGNRAWAAHGDTLIAALNAFAGTRLTLCTRRGQSTVLDTPLHDAAISPETLDAMVAAVAANYAVPRRILQLRAELQGTPALAWYDLPAPVLPSPFPELDWHQAVTLVDRAFAEAYPRLQSYFRSMRERHWIESERRPNKSPGGFKTHSPLTKEERIFMTFGGTMADVSTLAHEVGHAWHTHLLTSLRPCARVYPMTLGETASTFAEMLLSESLLATSERTAAERAYLIEQSLVHAPIYLLNIPVRFGFECRLHEERKVGMVPLSRVKDLMVEIQRDIYGDTLVRDEEDPWMWASVMHFYLSGMSFYNFPYTFGFLLSQALFAEFKRQGPAFLERYETFLRLTGSATCEEVVRESLGRDLRDQQFWIEAIQSLTPRIDEYAAIVAAR